MVARRSGDGRPRRSWSHPEWQKLAPRRRVPHGNQEPRSPCILGCCWLPSFSLRSPREICAGRTPPPGCPIEAHTIQQPVQTGNHPAGAPHGPATRRGASPQSPVGGCPTGASWELGTYTPGRGGEAVDCNGDGHVCRLDTPEARSCSSTTSCGSAGQAAPAARPWAGRRGESGIWDRYRLSTLDPPRPIAGGRHPRWSSSECVVS